MIVCIVLQMHIKRDHFNMEIEMCFKLVLLNLKSCEREVGIAQKMDR